MKAVFILFALSLFILFASTKAQPSTPRPTPKPTPKPTPPPTPTPTPTPSTLAPSAYPAGTVYVWGLNDQGQAGTGNTLTPIQTVNSLSQVVQASSNSQHSLYLSNGHVYATGSNSQGQLGVSGPSVSVPVQVTISGNPVISSVAAGGQHSLALSSTGSVYVWGGNSQGQAGLGTSTASVPITQIALPTGVNSFIKVYADASGSFLVSDAKDLWVSGNNQFGQLTGTPSSSNILSLTKVVLPNGDKVKDVKSFSYHTLVLAESGKLYAFGDNTFGQLGVGVLGSQPGIKSVDVTNVGTEPIAEIGAGDTHSTLRTESGKVYGWGSNEDFQSVYSSNAIYITKPTQATPNGVVYAKLASAGFHNVLLRQDGAVVTYGSNTNGQLGVPSTSVYSLPVVLGIHCLNGFVSAAYDRSYAVTQN